MNERRVKPFLANLPLSPLNGVQEHLALGFRKQIWGIDGIQQSNLIPWLASLICTHEIHICVHRPRKRRWVISWFSSLCIVQTISHNYGETMETLEVLTNVADELAVSSFITSFYITTVSHELSCHASDDRRYSAVPWLTPIILFFLWNGIKLKLAGFDRTTRFNIHRTSDGANGSSKWSHGFELQEMKSCYENEVLRQRCFISRLIHGIKNIRCAFLL